MKKLKLFYVLGLIIITLQVNAQLVNLNPDPNGDPWWTGDGIIPTSEEISSVSRLILSPESVATPLPDTVYNNKRTYFPPIFQQNGQSCVQAAEIGYCFTYEINRVRGVAAGDWDTNKENT